MNNDLPIEIKHNKKVFLRLFISLLVTTPILIYFCFQTLQSDSYFWLGIVSSIISLFMVMSIFANLVKYLNKKPGLIVDKEGIIDNISTGKFALIKWKDIKSIEYIKYVNTHYYIIFVHNPQEYIDQTSGMINKMVTRLYEDKGSPIAINPRLLDFNKEELLELWQNEIAIHHS